MATRRLAKVRAEIDALRHGLGSITAREFIGLAIRLGRMRVVRGKEPTFERQGWKPLTIPNHSGTLKKGTACSILDQLEADLEHLEAEAGGEQHEADDTDDRPRG
jgi:hypothetical protein